MQSDTKQVVLFCIIASLLAFAALLILLDVRHQREPKPQTAELFFVLEAKQTLSEGYTVHIYKHIQTGKRFAQIQGRLTPLD